ncbi:MAG: hypothetical protein AAGA27_02000 [Pseudomonadota bacterium]
MLAFIKFGVPASFPIHYPIEPTWTWELLLSAVLMSVITVYEFRRFTREKTFTRRWFGPPVFADMSIIKRVFYTVIISLLIFVVIVLSNNLRHLNRIFALQSSLTVLFYLALFHMIDYLKTTKSFFRCKFQTVIPALRPFDKLRASRLRDRPSALRQAQGKQAQGPPFDPSTSSGQASSGTACAGMTGESMRIDFISRDNAMPFHNIQKVHR